jgi:putative ABC transport system permease protein
MNYRLAKEYIIIALENLKESKIRSILTMLGIIIGISALIVMLMLGESSKALISEQMKNIGINTVSIYREGEDTSLPSNLKINDLKQLPFVTNTAYEISKDEMINVAQYSISGNITGISKEYFFIKSPIKIINGKMFSPLEFDSDIPVCLVDDITFNKYIKMTNSPYIYISGQRFNIVGVFKNLNDISMYNSASIYVPYFTITKLKDYRWNILLKLDSLKNINTKVERIQQFVSFIFRDSDSFKVMSSKDMVDFSKNISKQITLFIFAITLILLTVGGIGIMNIMLVSVSERTKEIGIRRALGATIYSIFYQFISETTLLCLIAGIVGILIGFIVGFVVIKIMALKFIIPISPIFYGIIVSISTGIISGIYPSLKAAQKNPIEALRYE